MATKKKAAAKKPAAKKAAKPKAKAKKPAAAKKAVSKKSAPKKAAASKAGVKKGTKLSCKVCGLAITVDNVCGCVEEACFMCCDAPMQVKRPAKKK